MSWGLGLGYSTDIPHGPIEIERRGLSSRIPFCMILAEWLMLRCLSAQLLRTLSRRNRGVIWQRNPSRTVCLDCICWSILLRTLLE